MGIQATPREAKGQQRAEEPLAAGRDQQRAAQEARTLPAGQSGEGARSVMEQLKQQERERAAQRQVEAGVPAAPPQPRPP